jgi:hypothetical protein
MMGPLAALMATLRPSEMLGQGIEQSSYTFPFVENGGDD